jgi:hypothetical protein
MTPEELKKKMMLDILNAAHTEPGSLLNATCGKDGITLNPTNKVTPPNQPSKFKPLIEYLKDKKEANLFGILPIEEVHKLSTSFSEAQFTDKNYQKMATDYLNSLYPSKEVQAEAIAKIDLTGTCIDNVNVFDRVKNIHSWFRVGRFDRVSDEIQLLPSDLKDHAFFERMEFAVQTIIMAFEVRKERTYQKAPWEPDNGDGWFEPREID